MHSIANQMDRILTDDPANFALEFLQTRHAFSVERWLGKRKYNGEGVLSVDCVYRGKVSRVMGYQAHCDNLFSSRQSIARILGNYGRSGGRFASGDGGTHLGEFAPLPLLGWTQFVPPAETFQSRSGAPKCSFRVAFERWSGGLE